MQKNHRYIHQLRHLIAPIYGNHLDIRVREDLTFEVPLIGFFKIAYSEKERARILYFARHPDQFVGKIEDNKYISLVGIEEIPHGKNLTWDSDDGRLQHDVTWAWDTITHIFHVLPYALLQEANLHRLDENTFVSGYISYRTKPDEKTPDLTEVTFATNNTNKFLPVCGHPPKKKPGEKFIKHLFSIYCQELCDPARCFPMELKYEANHGGKVEMRNTFSEREILPAVKGDFIHRMSLIWDGVEPVRWIENKYITVVRLNEKLQKRVQEMRDGYKKDRKSKLIKAGALAAHFLMEGPVSAIVGFVFDTAEEVLKREKNSFVPKQWAPAMRADKFETHLNQILLKVDREKFFDKKYFSDIEWLTAEGHTLNIDTEPNTDKGFSTWFRGNFFASYGSLFEHVGAGGKAVGMDDNTKIKAIRVNVPNGMEMYYFPSERVLYGYYHRQNLLVTHDGDFLFSQRYLPQDSDKWFQEGKVLKLDLKEGSKATPVQIGFDEFAAHFHEKVGTRPPKKGVKHEEGEYSLHRPHQYDPTLWCPKNIRNLFPVEDGPEKQSRTGAWDVALN
jgi:hypothetical protein